jgi:hypothetical protein
MDVLVSVVGGVLLLAPAVFPWGPRAQAVVSLYTAIGYLAVLPLPVLWGTRLYHVGLSLVFAVTTSIVSAYMLDRHRRATFYERERVASLAHQRELLIDASRLLNGTLALPELVGLVTDLGQRLTGADAVALAATWNVAEALDGTCSATTRAPGMRSAGDNTPLSAPTRNLPSLATANAARDEPTPGSTTTRWIEPTGKRRQTRATVSRARSTSCGGMSCVMSMISASAALDRSTPFNSPTYPSAVPKSVVSVMIGRMSD